MRNLREHKHLTIRKTEKRGRPYEINRKICPYSPINLVQVLPKGRFGEMISFEFHIKNRHEKTQKPLWLLGFQHRYLFRCYLLVAEVGLEPTTSGL